MKTKFHPLISLIIAFSLLMAGISYRYLPGYSPVNAKNTILSLYPNWYFPTSEYFSLFQSGTDFGSAVSGAGNVIVDGTGAQYDDVIIGAQKYKVGSEPYGAVFVFQGSAAGLLKSPALTVTNDQQGSDFGCQVARLGDVNADGFDDIAVGACSFNNVAVTGKDEGAAYVYYGPLDRPEIENWQFIGDKAGAKLGSAISGGDFNGDGIGDLIVGAKNYIEGEDTKSKGKVFIFFGKASASAEAGGFGTKPDWTAIGEVFGAQFGAAVDHAGFVNHDNYADLIIGAPYAKNDENEQAGCAYLYHGSSTQDGFDLIYERVCADMEPDDISGPQFGASVAGVGDVNGDGFDDVLIGSPYAKNKAGVVSGCVYLFLGSSTGLSTGEPWIQCGDQAYGRFGASIAAAGDLNTDGKADFLVGSPNYSVNNEKMGAVYLFFGKSGGVFDNPQYEVTHGNKAETEFGVSVSSAGDANGDDLLDVIVGAPNFKVNNLRYGRGMVYYAGVPGIPDEDLFSIFLPVIQK